MKRLLVLALALAGTLAAAGVDGTWKGSFETPNGAIERTFTFKAEGSKLTGETSSQMAGKSTINDGKVDGDSISFSITVKIQDNEIVVNYKGKVEGDEIKMKSEAGGNQFDYTVKRVR